MDVGKYSSECQEAIRDALACAKRYGHQLFEVEHVALFALNHAVPLSDPGKDRLRIVLQKYLLKQPKVLGSVKPAFGPRLDDALDMAELQAEGPRVTIGELWHALRRHSTAIANALSHEEESVIDVEIEEDLSPSVSQREDRHDNGESQRKRRRDGTHEDEARKDSGIEPPSKRALEPFKGFLIDLTEMAQAGKFDPVVGREREARRLIEILMRKKKNNPVLIGDPGVGKTAVVELLAQRIVEGRVPEPMKGRQVLALDLGAVLGGAKFRGEFEERLTKLVKVLRSSGGRYVLFIDEIHMLVGAGNPAGGQDAANLLKPALARGDFLCIGATTDQEYRQIISKDRALERRFQPLWVREPSRDETLSILRGLRESYEIFHGVRIGDVALESAIDLSMRYITDRSLPDKAIDTIDEAASRTRLSIESLPRELEVLEAEVQRLEIQLNHLKTQGDEAGRAEASRRRLDEVKSQLADLHGVWVQFRTALGHFRQLEANKKALVEAFEQARREGHYEAAARIQYGDLPAVEKGMEASAKDLSAMQANYTFLHQEVGYREVAEVISLWTGIDLAKLMENPAEKLRSLGARLRARIFGQDHALEKIARSISRAWAGVQDPNRPQGVFLFAGPTGVGKTEMARVLADELFGTADRLVRIDMSEYMEAHQVARLIGSPPGYVGFGEGGELTEAVRRQPQSIVLFDEIEKADRRVLDILLQVMEDGRLTDSQGRTIDFRQTMLILTSNLQVAGDDEEEVRVALGGVLRPEFVNRIDEVLVFQALSPQHLMEVVRKMLGELNRRLLDRGLRLELGAHIVEKMIADSGHAQFGGRAVRRAFQKMVVDGVAEWLLGQGSRASGVWIVDLDSDGRMLWRPYTPGGVYLPAG